MPCLKMIPLSAISLALSLAAPPREAISLLIRANTESARGTEAVPEVVIRVCRFRALSPWTLQSAETEAARVLQSASLNLRWEDCAAYAKAESWAVPASPGDLIIRFLAKPLPQVSTSALAIAGWSDGSSVAFLFYDRIVGTRSHTRVLPVILGRVMAHEIVHLLLPEEQHSQLGLMRGQWTPEDLLLTGATTIQLSNRSVLLMRKEALRRAVLRIDDANKLNHMR